MAVVFFGLSELLIEGVMHRLMVRENAERFSHSHAIRHWYWRVRCIQIYFDEILM